MRQFIWAEKDPYPFLDLSNPITVGSYMNEPDLMNNRYQLHLAMQQADEVLPKLFAEYGVLSGREYGKVEGYQCKEAQELLVLLGLPSYETAKEGVDSLRKTGEKRGL